MSQAPGAGRADAGPHTSHAPAGGAWPSPAIRESRPSRRAVGQREGVGDPDELSISEPPYLRRAARARARSSNEATDFLERQEGHRGGSRRTRENLDEVGRCPGLVGIAAESFQWAGKSVDGRGRRLRTCALGGKAGQTSADGGAGHVE